MCSGSCYWYLITGVKIGKWQVTKEEKLSGTRSQSLEQGCTSLYFRSYRAMSLVNALKIGKCTGLDNCKSTVGFVSGMAKSKSSLWFPEVSFPLCIGTNIRLWKCLLKAKYVTAFISHVYITRSRGREEASIPAFEAIVLRFTQIQTFKVTCPLLNQAASLEVEKFPPGIHVKFPKLNYFTSNWSILFLTLHFIKKLHCYYFKEKLHPSRISHHGQMTPLGKNWGKGVTHYKAWNSFY